MKNTCKRLFYYINYRAEKQQLQKQRHYRSKRTVPYFFIQRCFFFGNSVPVAVILCFYKVYIRLDCHHLYRILVYPHRNGKKYYLCAESKKNYGKAVIAQKLPTPLHNVSERITYIIHQGVHLFSFVTGSVSCKATLCLYPKLFSSLKNRFLCP